MAGRLRRLIDLVGRLLEYVAVVAVLLMMAHVVANAGLRTFANSPIRGTLEYVGSWYLPLIAMVGFVSAKRRGEHIAAPLLTDRLSAAGRLRLAVATSVVAAVACAGFTYYTSLQAFDAFGLRLTAGVIGLPIWPVTFIVPLAFGLMALGYTADALAPDPRKSTSPTGLGVPAGGPDPGADATAH